MAIRIPNLDGKLSFQKEPSYTIVWSEGWTPSVAGANWTVAGEQDSAFDGACVSQSTDEYSYCHTRRVAAVAGQRAGELNQSDYDEFAVSIDRQSGPAGTRVGSSQARSVAHGKPEARPAMTAEPAPIAPDAVWSAVRKRLQTELGADIFSSWFERMELESDNGGVTVLSVPTRFLRQWIQSHYLDVVHRCWQLETGEPRRVDIIVRSALRKKTTGAAPQMRAPANDMAHQARSQTAQHVGDVTGALSSPTMGQPITDSGGHTSLDPKLTFATFCEGRSNQLALAAAKHVATAGPSNAVGFNPLYIHASVGLGKTHLLHAICQEAARSNPSRRVRYLTAEHFMTSFVGALQAKTAIAFKQEMRDVDLLLVDDIQFLHGAQIQQEFCHLLNSMIDAKKQVVVVSDRPPVELEMLDERMRSRLAGGLLVDIEPPEEDLRLRIVTSRVDLIRMGQTDFKVPSDVVDYIVEAVTGSGRELDGAVNRLAAHSQMSGTAITLELAEQALRDLVRSTEPKKVKIEDIQRVVSKHFNVTKSDLLSARRNRTIVRPRQIAMYLSKALTPRSLPEIGRRFGGRDHTTVLHAVRKIEELTNVDEALAREIELLKQMLDG